MREATATPVRREDYAAPAFWIRSVELTFDLDPAKTIVASHMRIERNADAAAGQPLRLHGEDINLLRVQADGAGVPTTLGSVPARLARVLHLTGLGGLLARTATPLDLPEDPEATFASAR